MNSIPWAVFRRPDTGQNNGRLGLYLFIASEVMLFGALFSSLVFLRVGSLEPWPEHALDFRLGLLNTIILTISTFTIAFATKHARPVVGPVVQSGAGAAPDTLGLAPPPGVATPITAGPAAWQRYQLWMWMTVAFGFVFLGVKGLEWKGHLAAGHGPSAHNLYAIYFALTGLHFVHVMAGIAVNFHLSRTGGRMFAEEPLRFYNRVTGAGLYWNFVDVIWTVIFVGMYLS